VPDDPRFAPAPREEDHPDYHEDPVYLYNGMTTRLLESERQALLLTKTQKISGLPPSIQSLVGSMKDKEALHNQLVQRYIMQAHLWDTTKKKLRKRFDNRGPARGWKFKPEVGIPKKKTISILHQNLLRLCYMASCSQQPELLTSRRHIQDHRYKAMYKFMGEPIQVVNEVEWAVTSQRPLTPFAEDAQVIESISHEMPDLFPVAPTIDLKKKHIYKTDNITGFQSNFSHGHPHTLFLANDDFWYPPERTGRAVFQCFGQALAIANQKYGPGIKELPEPIMVQCVHSDGIIFNFLAFQLNTLDMSTASGGVKNLAWVDEGNVMFNKILPKRAMLRNTDYEDYDPTVFEKLLAVYMNGM